VLPAAGDPLDVFRSIPLRNEPGGAACLCGPVCHLDDQHVARGVDPIRNYPVDDAPRARAVREPEHITELGFVYATGRAIAAEDLRRVELADPALPHAPHDATHGRIVAQVTSTN
jgi:hypothetical protein